MPVSAVFPAATPTARPAPAPAVAAMPVRPFALAWGVFWLLLVTVAVQDHLRSGKVDWWPPVLWELSSAFVATVLLLVMWRQLPRLDPLLAEPWRWAKRPLALLPLVAPLFVGAVFAIRHAVYGLVGASYRHAPWPQVLAYESVKFAIFYLLFVAVVFGLRSFAALHAERLRAEANLALAREAQLAQLAQQIEPHFLFNALNTVASALPEQQALAERLLLRLAALLRTATDLARRPQVPLAEEIGLLHAYAEIMGQRFADRLSWRWRVDESLHACRVPALVLQPLLENAFRHGVERHAGPAEIEIEIGRVPGANGAGPEGRAAQEGPEGGADRAASVRLRASVTCSLGHLPEPGEASDGPPRGAGLANVRERLALLHGERASLTLAPREGGGVRATIELPCVS